MLAMSNIHVRVKFYGILTELAGKRELVVELSPPASLETVLDKVFSIHPSMRVFANKYKIVILRNGVPVTGQDKIMLSDNDRVELLPPSAGG